MGDRTVKEWLTLHPLAGVVSVFIAGLVLAHGCGGQAAWGFLTLALAAPVWGFCEWRRYRHASVVVLGVAVLALGFVGWQVDQGQVAANHLARLVPENVQVPVIVRVQMISDAEVRPRAGDVAPYSAPENTTRGMAEMQAVLMGDHWQTISGSTQLLVLEEVHWRRGAIAEITGMIARPRPPMNPGTFDTKTYLAGSGVYLTLRAKAADAIRLIAPGGGAAWPERFRLFVRSKLLEHTLPEDEDAAKSLVAVLLGYRSPDIRAIGRAFTDAGAAHLLAISGAHIAIIGGAVWLVLGLFVRRPGYRLMAMLVVVAVYALATPMGPPVLRAAIALLIAGVGRLSGRRSRGINIIAATALIVLLLRPADVLDAGFQLTFISTLCLVLLAKRMYVQLCRICMPRVWTLDILERRTSRLGRGLLKFLLGTLAVNSVGAVCSMPLVAYHFHQANPWGVFTGMLLLPAVAVVIVAGAVQVLVSAVSSWAGAMLAVPVVWIVQQVLALVHMLAQLPAACPGIRPPPVWLIALFFAVVLLACIRGRIRMSRATVVVLALGVGTLTLGWYGGSQRHDALHIWSLDVGQGSAIVLETPQGEHVLINAGSKTRSALTETVIEPFLRVQGINHVDAAILTQATRGQGSALASLLARYPTGHVFCSQEDINSQDYWWIHALLGGLHIQGKPPRGLATGDQVAIADLHIEILWPPRGAPTPARGLVMLMTCAQRRILVLGADDLPTLAALRLAPVDILLLNDADPAPAELIAAIPLRDGGIIIGNAQADATALSPVTGGCIHVVASHNYMVSAAQR